MLYFPKLEHMCTRMLYEWRMTTRYGCRICKHFVLFTFVVGKNSVSHFVIFVIFSLILQLTLDLYVFHVIINILTLTKRAKHCRKQVFRKVKPRTVSARVQALWNCSTPHCHSILSITFNIMSSFFFNSFFYLYII